MKIRHALDHQGYQALYILAQAPYLTTVPLLNISLIKRNDTEGEPLPDEFAGFVVWGNRILPADEIPGFVEYFHEDHFTEEVLKARFSSYLKTAIAYATDVQSDDVGDEESQEEVITP